MSLLLQKLITKTLEIDFAHINLEDILLAGHSQGAMISMLTLSDIITKSQKEDKIQVWKKLRKHIKSMLLINIPYSFKESMLKSFVYNVNGFGTELASSKIKMNKNCYSEFYENTCNDVYKKWGEERNPIKLSGSVMSKYLDLNFEIYNKKIDLNVDYSLLKDVENNFTASKLVSKIRKIKGLKVGIVSGFYDKICPSYENSLKVFNLLKDNDKFFKYIEAGHGHFEDWRQFCRNIWNISGELFAKLGYLLPKKIELEPFTRMHEKKIKNTYASYIPEKTIRCRVSGF